MTLQESLARIKMDSLKNKVVLITGASSGIGEETAVLFASLGSRLVLNGRNLENLNKVAQRCQDKGLSKDKILVATADVTKEDDVTGMVEKTISTFGHLDVLVNNAGILVGSRFLNSTMEDFDQVMNTNVRGVVMLTHKAAPYLIKTKGNIINVGSLCGLRPTYTVPFYTMSKAAVDCMTACLAQDLGVQGVRVNTVSPGMIKTGVFRRHGMSPGDIEKLFDIQKWLHPIGRHGEADEVAQAIAFLASDAAKFINGALLPVDGGRSQLTPSYVSGPLIV